MFHAGFQDVEHADPVDFRIKDGLANRPADRHLRGLVADHLRLHFIETRLDGFFVANICLVDGDSGGKIVRCSR